MYVCGCQITVCSFSGFLKQIHQTGLILLENSFFFDFDDSKPLPFPIRRADVVVPYWFDYKFLLNETSFFGNGSTLYYRQSYDHFLLRRATREIKRAFPNAERFSVTHLCIITWIIVDQSQMVITNVFKVPWNLCSFLTGKWISVYSC